MLFVRVTFGIFTIVTLFLFGIVFNTMTSDVNTGQYLIILMLLLASAFLFGNSAFRPRMVLSYLSIVLMSLIAFVAVAIPFGVAAHYNPDANYIGYTIVIFAPIFTIASILVYLVHRHFKRETS